MRLASLTVKRLPCEIGSLTHKHPPLFRNLSACHSVHSLLITDFIAPRRQNFTSSTFRKNQQVNKQAKPTSEAIDQHKDQEVEKIVHAAREQYGDRLPHDLLSEPQLSVYARLYGTARTYETEELEEESEDSRDGAEHSPDTLFRESANGQLVEVDIGEDERQSSWRNREMSDANIRLEQEILARFDSQEGFEEESEAADESLEHDERDSTFRAHPFTTMSSSGMNSTTLELPKQRLVDPISDILADVPNKHLDETSNKILGELGFPYGTCTPNSSRTLPQKPIPLSSSHSRMSEIEADVFLAAIMPGAYAAISSVLRELRQRLGSTWLQSYLVNGEAPSVLDLGSGGAGAIAWREMLIAEWCRIHSLDPLSINASDLPPLGKATVVTGSPAMRHRAAMLLENTTFLPRLPDYVHAHFESPASHRKQFDIILAPHSLWNLQEPWERRQRVLKLWNLLSKKGGILVLLEKGVPRGFEVIADSRQYIIDELFEVSKQEENDASSPLTTKGVVHSSTRTDQRVPSHIIAPCPHSFRCPLYPTPGISRQRKDYCHFSQRYFRPHFYQRMLGAKHRNHEDVEFSYIAVQKGRSPSPELLHGQAANDRAFDGYDVEDDDLPLSSPVPMANNISMDDVKSSRTLPLMLPLPRVTFTPLKRHGHVVLDVCAPNGLLERWTVPKSFGKQPYRDARKAKWGDLWALGAKHRQQKRIRIGKAEVLKGSSNADLNQSTPGSDDAQHTIQTKVRRDQGKARGRLKAQQRKRALKKEMQEASRAEWSPELFS